MNQQDLNIDWVLSPWLGQASSAQFELWRAENYWAALVRSYHAAPPPNSTEKPAENPPA